MYTHDTIETKFGPLLVTATSGSHILARTVDRHDIFSTEQEVRDLAATVATDVTLYGVTYRSARVDANTTHAAENHMGSGRYLDGYDREPATYRAQSGKGPEIGTSYRGYGVSMYRAEMFGNDPTEAAAKAFREEALDRLAEYVATPRGALLLARAEADQLATKATRAADDTAKAQATAREAAQVAKRAARALAKAEAAAAL